MEKRNILVRIILIPVRMLLLILALLFVSLPCLFIDEFEFGDKVLEKVMGFGNYKN